MNWLFLLQVNQGEAAAAAAPAAAQEGAAPAAGGAVPGFGACGGGGMGIEFIVWMVFLFGLMYFLLIRPQKKQKQEHEKMISSLKKGDRVMTTGGILATVRGISDNVVTVEIADGVLIRVRKEHVAGLQVESKATEAKK